MPRPIWALWPSATICIILAVLFPDFKELFYLGAIALWAVKFVFVTKPEPAVATKTGIVTTHLSEFAAKVEEKNRKQKAAHEAEAKSSIRSILAEGRGEISSDEEYGPDKQLLYDTIEAEIKHLAGDENGLTNADWLRLSTIVEAFRFNDVALLKAIDPREELIAQFRKIPEMLRELEGEVSNRLNQTKHAHKIQLDLSDFQRLPGPDILLWHAVATDSARFSENENIVWWILDQRDCDRATVAEFLISFVYHEFLEKAVKGRNMEQLATYQKIISNWNHENYPYQSISAHSLLLQPNSSPEEHVREAVRLSKILGQDVPALPVSIFQTMDPKPRDISRCVPSGLFYTQEGFFQPSTKST